MRCSRSLVLAALLGAAAPATAQTFGIPEVIGLTNSPTGLHDVYMQDPTTCLIRRCRPPIGLAPVPWAGGTAHDPRDRFTWITDGVQIAKVDPRNLCNVACPPASIPGIGPNDYVTGLAFDSITGTLYATVSDNTIREFSVTGCQLQPTAQCSVTLPLNFVLSGCATDDESGSIWYSAAVWVGPTPTPPAAIVYKAPLSAPCRASCRFTVPDCAGNLITRITGLGYDPCRDVLWVTDGTQVIGVREMPTPTTPCQIQQVQCCPNLGLSASFIGLGVLPATERSDGRPCGTGACPVCTSMVHRLRGDPVIGSAVFALELRQYPGQSFAFLLFNAGQCMPPGFPFLCAPVLVPLAPPPIVVGPYAPTGTLGMCDAGVAQPLPIPLDPSICGQDFATQWIGICSDATGLGNFVSNCLSWTVTGT